MINRTEMLEAYKTLGKKALTMNHYELAIVTDDLYTPDEWREFLQSAEIQEFIEQEMKIIRDSEMNKMIQDIGHTRSVGQAQALSALTKINDNAPEATGPIFIYCHVPLNEEQEHASNVKEETDVFGFLKP